MYTQGPKKMINLYILDILKRRSDAEHRLTQQDIIELLERDYGTTCERKAVSRNISMLKEFGIDIEYDGGYYMASREFTDSEIRLLISAVLFSKNLPHAQTKKLINKLAGLSSEYFIARVEHISTTSQCSPENKELFYTIEILDEAISKRKQVSFTYNSFGMDKKLHPRRDLPYIVNPYQIVASNGRYYVKCNSHNHETIGYYRLDRITNIKLREEPVRPESTLMEISFRSRLPQNEVDSIYMFSGETESITFRTDRATIGDVMDWFGNSARILKESEDVCTIRVTSNPKAMKYWALQYGERIEILSPQSLRDEVSAAALKIAEKYGVMGKTEANSSEENGDVK